MSAGNPSYKPSEGKREEFRKYLEKNGVMDALTKVLVNLYEEVDKPEDALEYIRDKLATIAGLETYKEMQQKLAEFDDKIKELEGQLEASAQPTDAEAGEQIIEPADATEPVEEQPPAESEETEPAPESAAYPPEETPEPEQ